MPADIVLQGVRVHNLKGIDVTIPTRKLRYTQGDLEENKVQVVRLIEDEVLRQAIGEGAARRRSMGWDPQIKKALELVARADLLLRDPKTYVAERSRERRLADASAAASN